MERVPKLIFVVSWHTWLWHLIIIQSLDSCINALTNSSFAIIEDMLACSAANSDIFLAYFYFSFNDTETQKVVNLLRSIISQIAMQRTTFPNPFQPPLDVLKETLTSLIEEQGETYLIIDVIDECPQDEGQRGNLCETLEEFMAGPLNKLHLLTTGRRQRDIEELLSQVPNLSIISFRNDLVDVDIRLYVDDQMVHNPKLNRWSSQLKDLIKYSFVNNAQGINKNALKVLLETLDETYERILSSIDSDYHEIIITALRWLVFANRPLKLRELAEASLIQPDDEVPFDVENRFASLYDVLQVLSGLVITANEPTFDTDYHLTDLRHYRNNLNRGHDRPRITTGS
ncbi:uncharacterized protein PAC_05824 [Phialocephala subalpina]|uniref:Nephrocystin 3-like N-terminal domain-containing protein n=1 Tax=Phialocephala subalpina TaxID=576137 RepID=A0A1L7WT61_9HELO|nr:uncharacterized protein PAC_05824 [Phialocephala subalpina]